MPSSLQDEVREGGSRAAARGPCDTLLKAREYNMKIWALEKFQRMMGAMFEVTPDQTTAYRSREAGHHAQPTPANVDLTHVLRNERLHGPTDRDPSAAPTDLVYFKGYFIYVHDMMCINRAIMVREFQKVSKREQGAWPQFRSVSGGKCPFIEEAVHQKREKERERQIEKMERARDKEIAEMAKSRGIRIYHQEEATRYKSKRTVLGEVRNVERRSDQDRTAGASNRSIRKDGLFQVPPVIPAKRNNVHAANDVAFTSANPTITQCGEPAASGVQPSNITSAIRSQMVSSIADQPGRRAGTSKGIYELKRKVAGNVLLGNAATGKIIPHSQRMINLADAARAEGQQSLRAVQDRKRKLGLNERFEVREEQEDAEKRTKPKTKGGSRKVPPPGYCENCRERFDDFDDVGFSWSLPSPNSLRLILTLI
jgi:regulatory subunit for Cdc7p protein kinase